jgi:hypothetical protein
MSLDILYKKLERARRECAIVCTTPSAIKSLMLKYVDMLSSVMTADKLLYLPENVMKPTQIYAMLKHNALQLHQSEWMADRLSMYSSHTPSCLEISEDPIPSHDLTIRLSAPFVLHPR